MSLFHTCSFQQMNRLTMMKCGINKLNSWCIPWNNECTLDYMEHAGKLICLIGVFLGIDGWMDILLIKVESLWEMLQNIGEDLTIYLKLYLKCTFFRIEKPELA